MLQLQKIDTFWWHRERLEVPPPEEFGSYGSVNQTVFIRGFKIAVRDDVLGYLSQKPDILPVPSVPPRKDPCGFAWWLIRLFCKINTPKRRRRANGVADVDRVPQLSQPFHPSDIITQYLFDKDPNALVAVTHDSEWITLIEMRKLMPEELTQKDRLEEALSEYYLLDSRPKNSAVCLQGKSTKASNSREVLPTSETSWYNKPFNSNFQVVITSIRAEDIVAGFRRMPVGFYVVVQFNGTKRRTENKTVRLHESMVEWDEKIQLPSEPTAKVRLSVCASFEFSPTLGTGEVLRTVEICVGDSVDNTRCRNYIS
ncbi:hypothetical protein JVT61DRAFT_11821 [Boletus reticuloceps]|uniref:C2 domain-containing protein n=1 Tax=Boletus reticuloceps TaxID=495285 RepID=A0A8I3ABL2_9AGAM|nr:hypothetical protein JVT61DRAFT_11821 [Boletus reticuloceps]